MDTTEFVFDSVATFNQNLLRVYKDGRVGFHWIYTPRKEVYGVSLANALNFPYEDVRVRYFMWDNSSPNGDVRFAEVRRNGKWGLINWKLEEVIAPQYLAMHRTLGERYILVEYEPGKQGYIDYDGREYFSRD